MNLLRQDAEKTSNSKSCVVVIELSHTANRRQARFDDSEQFVKGPRVIDEILRFTQCLSGFFENSSLKSTLVTETFSIPVNRTRSAVNRSGERSARSEPSELL